MPTDRFVFAHLADAHVGAWPRQPALRAALRASVLAAIAKAKELRVEFLLISGDLFHTPVPDPAEAAPVTAALRALVDGGTRIYAIYGSHDYVAHKTSWLDVLAEAGVFVRVAPESVRSEGTRWTLPFLVDAPTGAVIAGISGRSHGLDREYFQGVDAEAFRAARGFHVFQFHAAVEEYLPESLRGKILGIRRTDLPPGCQYYAGGHIHCPYRGEGPDGGLLINPGAIFGTSQTDLDYQRTYAGRHGLAIVRVEDGRPHVEFFDAAGQVPLPIGRVVVTDRSSEEIHEAIVREAVQQAVQGRTSEVTIALGGSLAGRTLGELGLTAITRDPRLQGISVAYLAAALDPGTGGGSAPASEAEVEADEFDRLAAAADPDTPWASGPEGAQRMRELLAELGTPRADGEARADYVEARRAGALRILEVRRSGGR